MRPKYTGNFPVLILLVIVILSATASAYQMDSRDIEVKYNDYGQVKVKIRNRLWLSDLYVKIFYGNQDSWVTVNVPQGQEWSNWTQYLPRPIRVYATAEGKVWEYWIP